MGSSKYQNSLKPNYLDEIEEQGPDVDEIREALELPDDAKFFGYLIYYHDKNEFLYEIKESSDRTVRGFVESPEFAHRFDNFEEVSRLVQTDKNETIAALFNLGKHLIVALMMEGPARTGATLH